ncbi:MAG: hypothetical protein EP343_09435 [Deltaproteobacteria bacterium]|nr:MAG: hypothetical protein EP343_09435 [Deltaproteobacteria bacterium]
MTRLIYVLALVFLFLGCSAQITIPGLEDPTSAKDIEATTTRETTSSPETTNEAQTTNEPPFDASATDASDATEPSLPDTSTQPEASQSACTGPHRKSCLQTGCPDGFQCRIDGSSQECMSQQCKPSQCKYSDCKCDPTTRTWKCTGFCAPFRCVDLCTIKKPLFHCCVDGKHVDPECSLGVFSCPSGSYKRTIPGCGPHSQTPQKGLPCNGKFCSGDTPLCCRSISTFCSKGTGACAWSVYHCDGAEDCGPSQVCCVTRTQSAYMATSCKAPKDCDALQESWLACHQDGDCKAGTRCCNTNFLAKSYGFSSRATTYGICLQECG